MESCSAQSKVKSVALLIMGVCIGTVLVQFRIKDFVRLQSMPTLSWTNWTRADAIVRPSTALRHETQNHISRQDRIFAKLQYIGYMRNDHRIDCSAVIANETSAVYEATSIAEDDARLENETGSLDIDKFFIHETKSCSRFVSQYGFITDILSEEERNFPIAYSIVAFKNTEMLMRQLRAIYRPQNYYCIHLDAKATSGSMYQAISAVAGCLPNVFMSSRRINVVWASFTVLEADLICMEDLWKYKKWKYYINLTGQEFPLKTNYELVKILQAYKGANDCPGTTTYAVPVRWGNRPFAAGLTPVKGPVHVTLSRPIIDFILHDQRSRDLQSFLVQSWGPDEIFFSTVNNNPHLNIIGSFVGDLKSIQPSLEENREYEFIANMSFNRYKSWMYENQNYCANKVVRNICILSTGDLPLLASSPFLFANKFYLQDDRVVIGCLEEMLMNRTRDYYMGRLTFDTTIYENSPFVKNRLSYNVRNRGD